MKYLLVFLLIISCKSEAITENTQNAAYQITKSISYNGISLNVIIDKPSGNEFDVLLVFHGTVLSDSNILNAASTTLEKFKGILNRKDIMIISVAYPQENFLLGDNIVQAEAALLWLKFKANQELGIKTKKIFLAGHSQGGYLVTRLNTMYETNGVVANAPGPLNLVHRCQLEENGQVQNSSVCALLKNEYGTTTNNANAYMQRSLLNFTNNYKSDILFVQGLNDTQIQMYSWPLFKQKVTDCTNCKNRNFVEISGAEHTALFDSQIGKDNFNDFITQH